MPFIDDPYRSEEPAFTYHNFDVQWSFDDLDPMMQPDTPRSEQVSPEELRATQARLHRLLVEAQDRLVRERGLSQPAATEQPKTNGETKGSDTSEENLRNGGN